MQAMFDLADDCQSIADEIDARLLDFSHPMNLPVRDDLADRSAKLRLCAQSFRLQAIDELVAAGTEEQAKLERAAGDATAAIQRITTVNETIAFTAALLQLAASVALVASGAGLASLGPAAQGLINAARPLLA